MSLNSLVLKLNDIDFGHHGLNDKDDPMIFLSQAGSGLFSPAITEEDIFSLFAFTDTGHHKGEIDFSSFANLVGYTDIDAFKIRETHGHIYVSGVSCTTTPATVPAPGALLLSSLGTGLLGWFRRRRTL